MQKIDEKQWRMMLNQVFIKGYPKKVKLVLNNGSEYTVTLLDVQENEIVIKTIDTILETDFYSLNALYL